MAVKTLYEIVAGRPVTNICYWDKFQEKLPDFFVILEEYDKKRKLCRQWGVDPETVEKVKEDLGSRRTSDTWEASRVPVVSGGHGEPRTHGTLE
ncbi:MAG: hypothetical protein KAV82_07760 [Phycisphaerae bacterium]|nr:hypothetical protein [Phycisphaerae bacterium]